MYIQCITRKSYSNRFIVELMELVDKHKDSNESRTHFIEDAVVVRLSKMGCGFNRPPTADERLEWEELVENI